MQTIREIKDVKNKQVTIKLPAKFEGKKVEVIVLPTVKKNNKTLRNLLLKGPVFSEKELKEFTKARKWINKWKIAKY